MSDKTPRTDAEQQGCAFWRHAPAAGWDFARQLERELTAAKAEIERLGKDGARLREEIEALTHEGRQGELEQANLSLATENERLREGLRWYADGHHYDLDDWEDCSGESANWLFPPSGVDPESTSWMVDDGGIARLILNHGHSINQNHATDDNITIAPDAAIARAK